MQLTKTIILLCLISLPVVWNSVMLVHYLVAHTHAFCHNINPHEHTPVNDCKDLCNIEFNKEVNDQYPVQKTEYFEIKNCLSAHTKLNLHNKGSDETAEFIGPHFFFQHFSDKILRPPISIFA